MDREELDFNGADANTDGLDVGILVEQTESGTLEQRTRIDGHHHSHTHHSKGYYKYRKAKHKVKKFFRQKKYAWITIAVIIMLTAALIAVSVHSQNVSKKYREMEEDTSITNIAAETDDESVSVKTTAFNSKQVLVNDIIADYMNSDNEASLADAVVTGAARG